jgi:hypothetical protein
MNTCSKLRICPDSGKMADDSWKCSWLNFINRIYAGPSVTAFFVKFADPGKY